MKKKSKYNKYIILSLCVTIATCSVATILVYFMNGTTTIITTDYNQEDIDTLVCIVNHDIEESFFKYGNAESVLHEVKISFINDSFDKFNYIYNATFHTEDSAKSAISQMHGDYNTYMDNGNTYHGDLTPVFMTDETRASINLFITQNNFTSKTATFVFLDNVYHELEKSSKDDFEKLYEAKGFNCKYAK